MYPSDNPNSQNSTISLDEIPTSMGRPFWVYILLVLIVGNFILQIFSYSNGSIFTDFSSYYRYWGLVLSGANYRPAIEDGHVWRFFTSMFLHINLPHLVANSVALLIVGLKTERIYGHSNFIGIYIMAGLFGGLTGFVFGNSQISAGASGAIFGLIGANLVYFYKYQKRLGEFGKNNLSYTIGILIANILYGLFQPNIDNWAHIGGLIAGICIGYLSSIITSWTV
jgi:rhomboid protease GluP